MLSGKDTPDPVDVLRRLTTIVAFSALLGGIASARADDPPTVLFRNHHFEPARIEVPAHTKFQLKVHNSDNTSDEFESTDLNREKVVEPSETITVFLGPLDPGEYRFFGD